jgi:DNA-binding MarR family transcriptional regulator
MAFALAFALLAAGMAGASFVAHFPQGTAVLELDKLAGEAEMSGDGTAFFPGHIGNYAVKAGAAQDGLFVMVSGEEESQAALAYEISWLSGKGALATTCETADLLALKNEREPVCIGTEWASCTIVPACVPMAGGQFASVEDRSFRLPSAAPAKALPSYPAGGAEISQYAPQPEPAPAQEQLLMADGDAVSSEQAASLQQQAGAEQALPLLAAFLAVLIISFLILQQRQETVQLEISPQEERLLQNETRAGIMEQLEQADRIPTDLSAKLGRSKATVVEHLETLVEAGFVERVATPGKKFVYYRLTHKGKRMLLKMAG